MLETSANKPSIFNHTRRTSRPIDQYRSNRTEWWLNVNYAELIEMKDAVAIQNLRAHANG
ncbi:hypothetical protein HCU74_12045 [Spongiibacter sp. KMU-166]|uniref:Uncharacterized protein n=1 Tax=Spongiibacter thalassae TaxID=2721624 RepID=A0ABX1GG01_9GAMM|nr:hypothetical protein [Spongiibacter thalassae]NKI18137.1 hypothetical protein [Spongiibacter thalassae]